MKLSPEQIEQLYAFAQQHFVVYYDLQTELVDHLANAIESESEKNPALSFDEILHSEFKKFGIFGFMDVIGNRQKALTRKYHKIVWKHFLEFLKLPKIAIVTGGFALIFYLFQYLRFADKAYAIVFGIMTIVILTNLIRKTIARNKKPKAQKRWLFEEILNGYGSVCAGLICPLQLATHFFSRPETLHLNALTAAILSFVLVVYVVFSYVITKVIPSKAKEYLAQTYPEYEMQQL